MNRRKEKQVPSENTGKEILINVGPAEKRAVILHNGKLMDFFMERESEGHYAGSIYKGRVKSILPGIEASFVDIGREKNGFLHVSDVIDKGAVLKEMLPDEDETAFRPRIEKPSGKIKDILKTGEDIIVQVVKEAMGTKGPRLTTFVSVPGRYIVLTPFDNTVGISRRIVDPVERKRIRDILERISVEAKTGCIVRTAAEKRSEEELKGELKYLIGLWERIKSRSEKNQAPITIYEEYGIVLRMIRDVFTEDMSQLIVDSKEEYNRIIKFLKAFMPSLHRKVKLYTGNTPLFQKYNLEKKIDEIFEKKVHLKSGGYLVIEQTEGVVVIDVNTGSYVGKRSLEETAFKTNVEAAEEIPRQLMLRDIGGIVIIDFIDMEEKDHRDKVFHALQYGLKEDKAKISLKAISQFGIVEMTRQRMRKSVEGTSHVECPYCGGKGMIKSVDTIAIEAVRQIERTLMKNRHIHNLKVTVHPDINKVLLSNQARMLSDIQRKRRCKIELREDRFLHIEDIMTEEML